MIQSGVCQALTTIFMALYEGGLIRVPTIVDPGTADLTCRLNRGTFRRLLCPKALSRQFSWPIPGICFAFRPFSRSGQNGAISRHIRGTVRRHRIQARAEPDGHIEKSRSAKRHCAELTMIKRTIARTIRWAIEADDCLRPKPERAELCIAAPIDRMRPVAELRTLSKKVRPAMRFKNRDIQMLTVNRRPMIQSLERCEWQQPVNIDLTKKSKA
jgi:hypothetical protein